MSHIRSDISVAGVIVTRNPDDALVDAVAQARQQVAALIVVDNGSQGLPDLDPEVSVVRNAENLGLGHALNQGLALAGETGAEWALTLDQDSRPEDDMVARLLAAAAQAPHPEAVAVVAPVVVDPGWKGPYPFLRKGPMGLFRRAPCGEQVLDPVTTAITSGSLVNLQAYSTIGPFREDFFIDYVDTEYCLRAQTLGFRIIAACGAKIHHRLGSRRRATWAGVPFHPTFHPPDRWYYISRNRISMLRLYALKFPHWLAYELSGSLYRLVQLALVEDRRLEKAGAIVRGTLDGLRGRMGPRPGPGRVPGKGGGSGR